MTHRLCFVSRNYRGTDSSGNKAKTDNETTLRELGAHNLGLPTTYYNSKVVTFILDLVGIVKMTATMKRGDIIVLQYPVKKYFTFICRIAHARGAKTITLIHDLGSMRRKKLTVAKEIERLGHSDYVIASNEKMETWLQANGLTTPTGALQLFDYRSQSVAPTTATHPAGAPLGIVYAGALAPRKNSFLLDIQRQLADTRHDTGNYRLHLYGNHKALPGLTAGDNIRLHGFADAETFIATAQGDMGLVWDGDSLDTCSGNFGEYLRWNSPHKVSFYLRAGLPIIIWDEAALAPLIERLGIGITIGNLNELPKRLGALTPEQLESMRKRIVQVSADLASGQFLTRALKTALDRIDS